MEERFKTIYDSKYKKVVVDTQTGKEREIILDQKTREMIANGDFLQPVGKDKKKFFEKYPHLKIN